MYVMLTLGPKVRSVRLLASLLLLTATLRADPFTYYYTFLSGGAGTGSLILNGSKTGASVVVSGSLSGPAPDSISVESGTVFNLIPGGTDFYYSGTVLAFGCCGSVSVGNAFGTWVEDVEAGAGGGVSGIDYSLNEPPPPDIVIPEPSSLALLAMGAMIVTLCRFRPKSVRG